jgi:GTP-binding protein
MAKLPTVAIIGRPNTGKSTLFNRLVGKRRAIVTDVAGTTRDHVSYRVEGDDVDYLLLDTGGIGGGSTDQDLEDDVASQSTIALEAADLILFTVNGREELTASDFAVADVLRKKRKRHVPVIVVLTKCDDWNVTEEHLARAYELNLGDDVIGVSAAHRINTDELEDRIEAQLKKLHFGKVVEDDAGRPPRIAILGKPNVGKSSLVNALLSDAQRDLSSRIVSDIPGTTRDSSDSIVRHEGKEYVFVDTAGLRRRAKTEGHIDTISSLKSIQAMEDSDVAVLVLDASELTSKQEQRIAAMAIDAGKGLVILVNKADLLTVEERLEKEEEIRIQLRFCMNAPNNFTSAKTRLNLPKLFALLESVARNRTRRIPTKELLRWFGELAQKAPGTIAKSKFVTQAKDVPPTFVLFCKRPSAIRESDLRFLENSLRATFAFEGTPMRWTTKAEGAPDA